MPAATVTPCPAGRAERAPGCAAGALLATSERWTGLWTTPPQVVDGPVHERWRSGGNTTCSGIDLDWTPIRCVSDVGALRAGACVAWGREVESALGPHACSSTAGTVVSRAGHPTGRRSHRGPERPNDRIGHKRPGRSGRSGRHAGPARGTVGHLGVTAPASPSTTAPGDRTRDHPPHRDRRRHRHPRRRVSGRKHTADADTRQTQGPTHTAGRRRRAPPTDAKTADEMTPGRRPS
jgi:hypothetical protein